MEPANKIDEVVNGLIDTIAVKKQRGFILNLASGDERVTSIQVNECLPPVDDWVPPARVRNHRLLDTQSFIQFALAYGNQDKSLVMVCSEHVDLILDEVIEQGDREVVRMKLEKSLEWQAFDLVMNRPMEHRDLHRFLVLWSNTLIQVDLIEKLRSMKVNMSVKLESDLQEDQKTIGFFVKTSAGEELKKFPKEIQIKLPVFDQDADEVKQWVKATLRLDIELPDTPNGKPVFTLICPGWESLLRNRLRAESENIAQALDGWNVVRGVHQTTTMRMGQADRDKKAS